MNKINLYDSIVNQLVTEKSTNLSEMNKVVFKKLNNVKCPTLYVHSENDRMSLEKNIDLVMNNISSKTKEKLIVKEASHHLFYKNPDQDKIFNTISDFIST